MSAGWKLLESEAAYIQGNDARQRIASRIDAALEAARAEATKADPFKFAMSQLCEIYFDIAASVLGEDEVRRRRDEAIAGAARRYEIETVVRRAEALAAIRAPRQPEPVRHAEGCASWWLTREGGEPRPCDMGCAPSSPPPPSATPTLGLSGYVRMGMNTPPRAWTHADECQSPTCKWVPPLPSEEPRACPDDGFPLNDHCLYERGYYGVPEPCVNNRMEHHAASYSCRAATPAEIKATHKCDLVGGDGGAGNCDHFGTVPSSEPAREEPR